eukprot:scaffold18700_cov132-Isochrysis_galbana.AAC.4
MGEGRGSYRTAKGQSVFRRVAASRLRLRLRLVTFYDTCWLAINLDTQHNAPPACPPAAAFNSGAGRPAGGSASPSSRRLPMPAGDLPGCCGRGALMPQATINPSRRGARPTYACAQYACAQLPN